MYSGAEANENALKILFSYNKSESYRFTTLFTGVLQQR
jgi:4-aminobutyrate aminotransferase-like enzyme